MSFFDKSGEKQAEQKPAVVNEKGNQQLFPDNPKAGLNLPEQQAQKPTKFPADSGLPLPPAVNGPGL